MVSEVAVTPLAENRVEQYRSLLSLCTTAFPGYREELQAILGFGSERFSSELSALVKVSYLYEEGKVIECIASTDEVLAIAESLLVKSAFVSEVADSKSVLARSLNEDENMGEDLGDVKSLIGAPVFVYGQLFGVICFYSRQDYPLSSIDTEIVEILAKGVAKVVGQQKSSTARLFDTKSDFKSEGVSSFEEYVAQASIPTLYGVAGRVLEVLQRRIGTSSLAIEHIAHELNLSKRTLQRRLQQQDVNFAQLRDQVRFHYSINLLVENAKSIDSISNSLDFSDRTSFTNAFKRWTNLSPSTFRKLFRDYA